MFQQLEKHPISFIAGICLLLFLTAGIFFNSTLSYPAIHYFLLLVFFMLLTDNLIDSLSLLIVGLCFAGGYILFQENIFVLLLGEIAVLILLTYQKKQSSNIFFFSLIALSFLFHLYYVQNTSVDVRQHDLSGILFYIKEITNHGFNFYHFNPWRMYYLFHQPFHFIIAGYIYLIELKLWVSGILAQEGLQYLSLFYTTATIIVAYAIFNELHLSKKSLYAALILFAFNPTLFLFSGYISNDVPAFFWTMLFLYNLLRWYHQEKLRHIIYAAICFGFGVLTKLSILTVSPAVFILFLYKLYKTAHKSDILKALCVFTIIAVPLSLVWIIRNHILYDMPFYNIPDTSPAGQNFKYLSFFDRIFDFSGLLTPFINAPQIAESNMWLALIKTELFGEWDMRQYHTIINLPAFILYIGNILIKLLALGSGFFILIKAKKQDFLNLFFAGIYFIVWLYSFKYALDYPYICSTDYRLFTVLMLPEIVLIAQLLQKKDTCFLYFAGAYGFLSCFIYTFGI